MSNDTNHDHGSSHRSEGFVLLHECSSGLYRAWDRLMHNGSIDRDRIPFVYTCLNHLLLLLLPKLESFALKIAVKMPGGGPRWRILSTKTGDITKERKVPEEWVSFSESNDSNLKIGLEPLEPNHTGSTDAPSQLDELLAELRKTIDSIQPQMLDKIAKQVEAGVRVLAGRHDRQPNSRTAPQVTVDHQPSDAVPERDGSQPDEKVIEETANRVARHLADQIVELKNDSARAARETGTTTFAIRTAIPGSVGDSYILLARSSVRNPGARGHDVVETINLINIDEAEPQLAPALRRAFESGFLSQGHKTDDQGRDSYMLCIPCHFEGVPWVVVCHEYQLEEEKADPAMESLKRLRAFWKYEEVGKGIAADVRQEGQVVLGSEMDLLWKKATSGLRFRTSKSVMNAINLLWKQLGYVFPVCFEVQDNQAKAPDLTPWKFDLGEAESTPLLELAHPASGRGSAGDPHSDQARSEWHVPHINRYFWEYIRTPPDDLGRGRGHVEKVTEFIANNDCGIVYVIGNQGAGKTELLRHLHDEEYADSNSSPYLIHLECQSRSGRVDTFNTQLVDELQQYQKSAASNIPARVATADEQFQTDEPRRLIEMISKGSAPPEEKLVLLIDESAVKDSPEGSSFLSWFEASPPSRVFLVHSTRKMPTQSQPADASLVVQLDPDPPIEESTSELSDDRRSGGAIRRLFFGGVTGDSRDRRSPEESHAEAVQQNRDLQAHILKSLHVNTAKSMVAGQNQARNRFSHEMKHLSRAFSSYWHIQPSAEILKAVACDPSSSYWSDQEKWRIVPFPEILISLRRLFQVWCGIATPDELFGIGKVPETMTLLVRSCFDLMRNSLKPLACSKKSVHTEAGYRDVKQILDQVDALWSDKGTEIKIHCADNVPDPPASWAKQDTQKHGKWMYFTQLLLAIFSNVVRYADSKKPIEVTIKTDPDSVERLILTFRNEIADENDDDTMLAEIRRARKELTPLSPDRHNIKTEQVIWQLLDFLSDDRTVTKQQVGPKTYETSCVVRRQHLLED